MMKKLLRAPKKAATYFEKEYEVSTPEKCSESTLSEERSDDKNYYCDTTAYENHLSSIGEVKISAFSFDAFESESSPVKSKQQKNISSFTCTPFTAFETPATREDSSEEPCCSGFDSHFKANASIRNTNASKRNFFLSFAIII